MLPVDRPVKMSKPKKVKGSSIEKSVYENITEYSLVSHGAGVAAKEASKNTIFNQQAVSKTKAGEANGPCPNRVQ